MRRVLCLSVCGLSVAVACGGSEPQSYPPSAPVGPCNAVEQQHPIEGQTHVDVCSHIDYQTRPPSSGDHYPIWAAYRSYPDAIPEGFWVHDLEHGAVVFSYNCTNCADQIAAAQALIDAQPDDPLCTPVGLHNRFVMTPDPHLDVPFAASTWGWTLRADCFDAAAFGDFVKKHYGQGREPVCGQGQDVSTGLAPGCGQ